MMLKLVLLCALAVSAEVSEEEDVLVLKKTNFEEALKAHPNILVEFCKYTRQGLLHGRSPPSRSLLARALVWGGGGGGGAGGRLVLVPARRFP